MSTAINSRYQRPDVVILGIAIAFIPLTNFPVINLGSLRLGLFYPIAALAIFVFLFSTLSRGATFKSSRLIPLVLVFALILLNTFSTVIFPKGDISYGRLIGTYISYLFIIAVSLLISGLDQFNFRKILQPLTLSIIISILLGGAFVVFPEFERILFHLFSPISQYGDPSLRIRGLTDEASVFAFILFNYYIILSEIKPKGWIIIKFCVLLALFLTFSTLLILYIPCLVYLYAAPKVNRNRSLLQIILITAMTFIFLFVFNSDFLKYTFVEKLFNYLSPTNDQIDSGSFRQLTALLGFSIFADHPYFGVGAGQSLGLLHVYSNNLGVGTVNALETLTIRSSTPIQSAWIGFVAEFGIAGLLIALLLVSSIRHGLRFARIRIYTFTLFACFFVLYPFSNPIYTILPLISYISMRNNSFNLQRSSKHSAASMLAYGA